VSGRLSMAASWRLVLLPWFPVAFRPPAFASRSSHTRRGLPPSSRSAYRAPTSARTSTGLPRSAHTSSDRGGCPLYPGDGGALQTDRPDRPAPAASQRPVPAPHRPASHHDEAVLHEASTRVQAIHPSGLPLTRRRPDGNGQPLRLFPGLRTPPDQEPDNARQSGDRPSSTDLELRAQLTSVDLQSGSSLVVCDLASHGRKDKSGVGRRAPDPDECFVAEAVAQVYECDTTKAIVGVPRRTRRGERTLFASSRASPLSWTP
jgi:hypothetical protein